MLFKIPRTDVSTTPNEVSGLNNFVNEPSPRHIKGALRESWWMTKGHVCALWINISKTGWLQTQVLEQERMQNIPSELRQRIAYKYHIIKLTEYSFQDVSGRCYTKIIFPVNWDFLSYIEKINACSMLSNSYEDRLHISLKLSERKSWFIFHT